VVTKEYGGRWIFEPCLTCSNARRRVQNPGFSLVSIQWIWGILQLAHAFLRHPIPAMNATASREYVNLFRCLATSGTSWP
jgi:hypothetical protein